MAPCRSATEESAAMRRASTTPASSAASFLAEPPPGPEVEESYERERAASGYVWNKTRLWGWRPDLDAAFADLRSLLMESTTLTERELALLVTATAAGLGDSYCSLAWGPKLAALSSEETAAQVIAGAPAALTSRETALAEWARAVVEDANATTAQDVERLRAAGLDEREILEATVFIALHLGFSTVNDAL